MALLEINRQPSRRQLAVFGLVWVLFFGTIGTLIAIRSGVRPAALVLWGLALAATIGWAAPAWMRILYLGMSYLGLPVGYVVSFVILAVVWFLVFTPIGWALRLAGYDPLGRRFEPERDSYWTPHAGQRPMQRYFRQY